MARKRYAAASGRFYPRYFDLRRRDAVHRVCCKPERDNFRLKTGLDPICRFCCISVISLWIYWN